MFCVSCSIVAHRGRHAAPLGNVGFPLVLQGIPYETALARLGDAAAGSFRQPRHFMVLLVFLTVFDEFW